jgi:hypothetical protein
MIYHVEQNKPKEGEDLNLPLLSPLNQDEMHGFIADINTAI